MLPTQMSALPSHHQWLCPFSSPGQQESNLTFTFTSMFAIRVTFIFVILRETQVFGLQWSREHKSVSLSRHLHSTPAMLPKSQDKQGKDFQQGRKSIIESNRGSGIYGSTHQVLSFPLHHSYECEKKSVTFVYSLHITPLLGCRKPGCHQEHNLRASDLSLGKLGPLYNPLSVSLYI